jgi:hypothetical protein
MIVCRRDGVARR